MKPWRFATARLLIISAVTIVCGGPFFEIAVVDDFRGVAVDAAGNAYVVGWAIGTFAGQSAAGGTDAFVRKFDSAGTELWTRQFGTAGDDHGSDGAVDSAGNAYVVGTTSGTFPGQISAGRRDAFVRKLDRNGTELWTRQFGTADFDDAFAVAIDALGNVYVAGWTLGGTFAGQTSAGGNADAFVRKLDRNGTELWTRQFGTAATDEAADLAVEGSGNVYVAGSTSDTNGSHAFMRKFDGTRTELWTASVRDDGFSQSSLRRRG